MADAERPNSNDLVPYFTQHWLEAEPMVSSFIFSAVRDFQHAEDLLQTVAMDAAASIGTFDRSRPFGPWIMGIARHRVLKHYRARAGDRLCFDEQTLETIASAHEAVEDELGDRRRALRACVERLADRTRQMITLRYEGDLSASEIATRLSTSANAVYITLHRARQSLSECIEAQLGGGAGGTGGAGS